MGTIVLEPGGFSVRGMARERSWRGPVPGTLLRIQWDQIDRIIAYKDDLFGYDNICLGFFINGGQDKYFWVDEEMVGWKEFTDRLEDHFRIGHKWFSDVMFPPFERCEQTLWERPK